AARYLERAAGQALEALAFDRAAENYREVLRLGAESKTHERQLYIKLGNALANAGRGADAAEAYLAAVEGGTAAETLELERRAAEQLLRSGHVERGLSVLNAVLARVGLRMPKTTHGAVALTLWRRLHLRLRGVGFRKRDVSQISAEALTRLDATWSAS